MSILFRPVPKIVKQQSTYLGEWLPWVAKADNEGYFLEFINKALHDYANGREPFSESV